MNRTQARAVLQLQRSVTRSLDACLRAFPEGSNERANADAYWAGALRSIVNGNGYGSAPVFTAEEVLDGSRTSHGC